MCSVIVEGVGDTRRMRLQLGRGAPIVLASRPVGAATPIAEFCGEYRSEELASSYAIVAHGGDLIAAVHGPRDGAATFALRRVADDVFYPLHQGQPVGAVFTFVSPSTLCVSASKAEGVLFQRATA
jgi:hypothetical protein